MSLGDSGPLQGAALPSDAETAVATHAAAADPHPGYVLESDVGTDAGNVVQLDDQARLPAVDGSQLLNLPGGPGGASDHGALTGLSDDDHSQYVLVAGTRALTGVLAYTSVPTFTADLQIVTKGYVDGAITLAGGYTDEAAQDAVGGILADSDSIGFTYTDGTPSITAALKPTGVDHDSLLNFVANEHIDWTVEQGATNVHAGNIPDLSDTYAVAGKGVTNGDSHDHSGGDGAQIAYSSLSGAPTAWAASAITSGTLDIARIPTGTTGTTVALGNDSRLSDVRTPTAHAASHGSAGSDAITPASIGAEAAQTAASQAEVEAGTESAIRSMSPLRIAQAIAALAPAAPSGSGLAYEDETMAASDLTLALNTHTRIDASGLTADRKIIAPPGEADGDIVEWELTADTPYSSGYALLLRGAVGAPINFRGRATAAATDVVGGVYCQRAEFGRMRWDATAAEWRLLAVDDGRRPIILRAESDAGTTLTINTSTIITLNIATQAVGGWVTGGSAKLARSGLYQANGGFSIVSATGYPYLTINTLSVIDESSADPDAVRRQASGSPSYAYIPSLSTPANLVRGIGYRLRVNITVTATGHTFTASTAAATRPQLTLTEILQ